MYFSLEQSQLTSIEQVFFLKNKFFLSDIKKSLGISQTYSSFNCLYPKISLSQKYITYNFQKNLFQFLIKLSINKNPFYIKILNIQFQPKMISFQKTNQKGQKILAYTHKGYLSSHYASQICKAEKNARTTAGVIGYGITIASYWAFNNVPVLNKFIKSKLPWKGGFLVASAVFGIFDSLLASFILKRNILSKHQTLLKNEVFPGWFNKQRVVNPYRVFFELDDNRSNEPNIWHSAITPSTIQKIIPDFIVGNPYKPHVPVADEHHH